jgi:hypothetical protein
MGAEMAFVELQIDAATFTILSQSRIGDASSVVGLPFTVNGTDFVVGSLSSHADATLHYDEPVTYSIFWKNWRFPTESDPVTAKKTQVSRTFTGEPIAAREGLERNRDRHDRRRKLRRQNRPPTLWDDR